VGSVSTIANLYSFSNHLRIPHLSNNSLESFFCYWVTRYTIIGLKRSILDPGEMSFSLISMFIDLRGSAEFLPYDAEI